MEIKIKSLKDAEKYIQILFEKNGFTNQNILDEIIHLRSEMSGKIDSLKEDLVEKIDENTLAVKTLNAKFVSLNESVDGMKTEQTQTNKELADVKTEFVALNASVGEMKTEQTQTNKELVQMKAEFVALNTLVGGMQTKQDQTNKELAEIKEILKNRPI